MEIDFLWQFLPLVCRITALSTIFAQRTLQKCAQFVSSNNRKVCLANQSGSIVGVNLGIQGSEVQARKRIPFSPKKRKGLPNLDTRKKIAAMAVY